MIVTAPNHAVGPFLKPTSPHALAAVRREARITQACLAERIGVAQQYVSKLESDPDAACSSVVATAIASCLGRPLEDLFVAKGHPRAPEVARISRLANNSGGAGDTSADEINTGMPARDYPDGDPRKWWTMEEFADMLRVPIKTARQMRRDGVVGADRRGKRWLIPDVEVVRLSKEAAAKAKATPAA